MLLCQVKYYPLVKKILSYLLASGIRRRFNRIRRGVIVLQSLWRRQRHSHVNIDSSDDEEIIEEFGDFLCPSPAVIFKGTLLTTPRRIPNTNSIGLAPLRSAPSIATPVRTSKGATRIVQERLETFLLQTPTKQSTPSSAKIKLNPPSPHHTQVHSTTIPSNSSSRRKAQRVIRNASKSPADDKTSSTNPALTPTTPTAKRSISDEAELAKITQQNTRANSGYQTLEITVTDLILDKSRPPSPSNTFCKTSASKRKWADLERARHLTQRAWEEIHSEKSPKERRIKWNPQVEFIDEPDIVLPAYQVLQQPSPIRPAIKATIEPDAPSLQTKVPLIVQRILYLSEIEPKKKTPSKRNKNQK
jgi:hypothetical protein